jgi:uncharacterized protein
MILSVFSGVEEILSSNANLVDLFEIEPETIWIPNSSTDGYRIEKESLEKIISLNRPKLLHGIGFPVGGTRPPLQQRYDPFIKMISLLNPPWVSEHLSFNLAEDESGDFNTGFMLPPRQTNAGVDAAIRSISSMKSKISVPLAIETGENYLKYRSDELMDGEFIAKIVRGADCGILLDLHNLWTNEVNGRQPILEFLNQIPLDRVWEIHIAGGTEYEGYWVDSHSGKIPKVLIELTSRIIPYLHNLKAMIFEMFPSYILEDGIKTIESQLEILKKIWNLRTNSLLSSKNLVKRSTLIKRIEVDSRPTPKQWEDVLGSLVVDRHPSGILVDELSSDLGISVIKGLIAAFRSSMIATTLKLTSKLLFLTIGERKFAELLKNYWKQNTPNLFSYQEAVGFADFLLNSKLGINYLDEVLQYEIAIMKTIIDDKEKIVRFTHDPLVILRALSEGRMPTSPKEGNFEIELTPDIQEPHYGSKGKSVYENGSLFFH